MKTRIIQLLLITAALTANQSAHAGYNMYPPILSDNYAFFEDSDNAKNAAACQKNPADTQLICIRASYLPKGVHLANTDRGRPMLSQGLFFSPLSWTKHTVVYNITLESDFGGFEAQLEKVKTSLANLYGVKPHNIQLSPINVGTMQFVVRNTFGSGPAPQPSTLPNVSQIALSTTFTETLVPAWTGEFHNLSSRFSVSIRGPVWDLEPGLKEMFLSDAENGTVGSVSFNIPVMAKAIKAKFSCDLTLFQDVYRSSIKSWNITRITRGNSSTETFNNDEKNAVRAGMQIADYCKITGTEDSTLNSPAFIKERGQEIFTMLFNKAFKQVSEASAPTPIEGKDAKYTLIQTGATSNAHAHIEVELDQDYIFNLKSDLDFYAGGVTKDQLSPAAKYLCQHFERYKNGQCEVVCEPMKEVYLKGHPRADATTGCVDITLKPLFE